MTTMDDSKKVMIPRWLVEAGKIGMAAGIAILSMYIKVEVLQTRLEDTVAKLVKLEAALESQRIFMQADASRISVLETRQSLTERSITESLIRIEADIKEVKREVKDIQQRVK